MEQIVNKLGVFLGRYERLLVATPEAQGRNLNPAQFEVGRSAKGRRILLLDDTFTTGAKLFSAAAALRHAGAEVVGPVVIGRHAQPSWQPTADLLDWLSEREWDQTRCCRCNGERKEEGLLF
jgi:adenine/guanine phosphoribosyltransferase-like PRPP-binding protein